MELTISRTILHDVTTSFRRSLTGYFPIISSFSYNKAITLLLFHCIYMSMTSRRHFNIVLTFMMQHCIVTFLCMYILCINMCASTHARITCTFYCRFHFYSNLTAMCHESIRLSESMNLSFHQLCDTNSLSSVYLQIYPLKAIGYSVSISFVHKFSLN